MVAEEDKITVSASEIVTLKMTLLMVLAGACLFCGCSTSRETGGNTYKWIYYGELSSGDKYYYDNNSITNVNPESFKVWTKVEYSNIEKDKLIQGKKYQGSPTAGLENLYYTIRRIELDCENNTSKNLNEVEYDNKGQVLDDFSFPDAEREKIPPSSVNELLLKTVCKRSTSFLKTLYRRVMK